MSALRRLRFVGLALATAFSGAGISTTANAEPPDIAQVGRTIQRMSLEEKVGQLFVLFAYGPDANQPDARNTSLYGVATPAEVVEKYKPGGWIYFDGRGNVQNPTQLATYSNQLQTIATSTGLRVPLLISTLPLRPRTELLTPSPP